MTSLNRAQRTGEDLHEAAKFFSDEGNQALFPIDAVPTEISHFVLSGYHDDDRAYFETLAERVVSRGGTVVHHPDMKNLSVQHIARLPFGSGRVVYRVVWIEHGATLGTMSEYDGEY